VNTKRSPDMTGRQADNDLVRSLRESGGFSPPLRRSSTDQTRHPFSLRVSGVWLRSKLHLPTKSVWSVS